MSFNFGEDLKNLILSSCKPRHRDSNQDLVPTSKTIEDFNKFINKHIDGILSSSKYCVIVINFYEYVFRDFFDDIVLMSDCVTRTRKERSKYPNILNGRVMCYFIQRYTHHHTCEQHMLDQYEPVTSFFTLTNTIAKVYDVCQGLEDRKIQAVQDLEQCIVMKDLIQSIMEENHNRRKNKKRSKALQRNKKDKRHQDELLRMSNQSNSGMYMKDSDSAFWGDN